jgi:transcription elongation factor Elf1
MQVSGAATGTVTNVVSHERRFGVPKASGTTQCPRCGAVSTYPIMMHDGGQVITCKRCHKNFTAEVRGGEFTGNNR